MAEFPDRHSFTGELNESDTYSVLTSLGQAEEEAAVHEAVNDDALGLQPWFGFGPGESVHIFPLDSLFPGVSRDAFVADVEQSGVVRANTGETEVTLDSGEIAMRMTRREADDNGDFTYDLVLADIDDTTFVVRIVKSDGYSRTDFETIFRSFEAIDK